MSIDGIYLNIIKVIHNKSTVKIIFSAQMPKGFPLRSRKRQGCPFFYSNSTGSGRNSNQTRKRNKSNLH